MNVSLIIATLILGGCSANPEPTQPTTTPELRAVIEAGAAKASATQIASLSVNPETVDAWFVTDGRTSVWRHQGGDWALLEEPDSVAPGALAIADFPFQAAADAYGATQCAGQKQVSSDVTAVGSVMQRTSCAKADGTDAEIVDFKLDGTEITNVSDPTTAEVWTAVQNEVGRLMPADALSELSILMVDGSPTMTLTGSKMSDKDCLPSSSRSFSDRSVYTPVVCDQNRDHEWVDNFSATDIQPAKIAELIAQGRDRLRVGGVSEVVLFARGPGELALQVMVSETNSVTYGMDGSVLSEDATDRPA